MVIYPLNINISELDVPSEGSPDMEAAEGDRNDGGKFEVITSCKEELQAQSQMNEDEVHREHGITCMVPLFNTKGGNLDVGKTDVEEMWDRGERAKCFGASDQPESNAEDDHGSMN
ncbi:hypothetical protein H0H87_002472 [Tephrocybe sp. NHM501043]|nr:hypothetical protein H0H87_002472 [Tephrocybe sp. NHM501043]